MAGIVHLHEGHVHEPVAQCKWWYHAQHGRQSAADVAQLNPRVREIGSTRPVDQEKNVNMRMHESTYQRQ